MKMEEEKKAPFIEIVRYTYMKMYVNYKQENVKKKRNVHF